MTCNTIATEILSIQRDDARARYDVRFRVEGQEFLVRPTDTYLDGRDVRECMDEALRGLGKDTLVYRWPDEGSVALVIRKDWGEEAMFPEPDPDCTWMHTVGKVPRKRRVMRADDMPDHTDGGRGNVPIMQ